MRINLRLVPKKVVKYFLLNTHLIIKFILLLLIRTSNLKT